MTTIDGMVKTMGERDERWEKKLDAAMGRMEAMFAKLVSVMTVKSGKEIGTVGDNNDDVDSAPNIGGVTATVGLEEKIAEKNRDAEKAQEDIEFDAGNVYETLVNPSIRTKMELEEFVDHACARYSSKTFNDLNSIFYEDFLYWNASHFKLVKKTSLQNLRDVLVTNKVPIRKEPMYPIYKALAEFVDNNWGRNRKRAGIGTGFETKPPEFGTQVEINFLRAIDVDQLSSLSPVVHEETPRTRSGTMRLSDVGKLFHHGLKYSGKSTEPLRRRFTTFKNAVGLCNIDPEDTVIMFPLFETSFLTGQALHQFQDVFRDVAGTVGDVIDLLEDHFLSQRAKRVNDDIWSEISYHSVKKRREKENKSVLHEYVLSDLIDQVKDLSDIRTGPGNDSILMAKIIPSVRNVSIYSIVCQNPPVKVQELISVPRSCALEADRADINKSKAGDDGKENGIGYKTEIKKRVRKEMGYYIDRRARQGGFRSPRGSPGPSGYGRPISRSRSPRYRVPSHICIVCGKSGCHSSKHRQQGKRFLNNLATAYHGTEDDIEDSPTEKEDEEDEDTSGMESGSTCMMISDCRSFAAMGIYPSSPMLRVDACLLDTGCNKLSTIGDRLVSAARVASVRSTVPEYKKSATIHGIGGNTTAIKGKMKFHFLFGGELCTILLHIVAGEDPMLLSHADMDMLGLNYQSGYKIVERMSDHYTQDVEMRNGLPFLVFETVGFLSTNKLRAIHRNLGHPSVEKQMKVLETAELEDLPRNTRTELERIVKHCKACQLNKAKPRRFLFALKDGVTGEFNHILEIDVMKLDDGNVLHTICSGTGFQQGQYLSAMSSVEAWKTLRRCWINIYAGAPDYIHADAGSNFVGKEFISAANELGVVVKIAPTEGHERIGKVERAHATLRSVYNKLKVDLPNESREERLSLPFAQLMTPQVLSQVFHLRQWYSKCTPRFLVALVEVLTRNVRRLSQTVRGW